MTAPKVGDAVAWADVPDGAMVREERGYYLRMPSGGHCLGILGGDGCWESWAEMGGDAEAWDWMEEGGPSGEPDQATIIALDLTGQETAADLQRLAEVFEAREALTLVPSLRVMGDSWFIMLDGHVWPWGFGANQDHALRKMSERLHAAGWRKGMTAEDAARLLAAAEVS